MTNNLLLYGSFARGDNTTNSDIDLLSLVDGKCEKISVGQINLFLYNYSFFIKMAKEGSLFVFHLKEESKVLNDEEQVFNHVFKNYFHLKNNYNAEILFSYDLMSMIATNYDNLTNYGFANKRISWCARTTISALGANEERPIFSITDIIKYFGVEVSDALGIKNSHLKEPEKLSTLLSFCFVHSKSIDRSDYILSQDLENYKNKSLNSILGNYT